MNAKEFRENQGVSIPEWNDIIDKMLEAYNKSKVEAISDNIQTIIDAINYAENEENANYVITNQDKELLNQTLKLLKQ